MTKIHALTAHILSVILLTSIFLPQIMSRGYATPEEPKFQMSAISVKDTNGNDLGNIISPGQGIVLAFNVTNDGNSAQSYVGVLQISNEAGTVFFAWRTGTASPGESISLDFTWQAEKVGPYTFTAFVWTSLNAPTALSEPSEMVISTCTPGYWKQEQHFDSYPAGITPDTQLDVLLGFEIPGYETTTVLQALQLKGGAANGLIRQGTAGMLNVLIPNVDYDFSEATTLRQFQDGLDPQLFDMWPDADDDMEQRKDALDAANNAGCPLN